MKRIMERFNFPEDEPIEARMVNRSIEGAQRKVEGHNFDIRKHLLEYDDVMNQQRTIIYGLRREVLEGDVEVLERKILDLLGDSTSDILDFYANETAKPSDWDLKGLSTALMKQFGVEMTFAEDAIPSPQEITEAVSQSVKEAFDKQKQELGPEIYPQVLKMFYLQTIDGLWKDHLKGVDKLKEGINLRAYAQKDPLVEYKKEAFNAFQNVLGMIKSETVEKILKVKVKQVDQIQAMEEQFDDSELDYAGSEESATFSNQQMIAGMMGNTQSAKDAEQTYQTNRDQGSQDSNLNREQRRRQEKKKRKLKF
jgi:preprotein translocase subunit SecA